MEIAKTVDGNAVMLSIEGMLDAESARMLGAEIAGLGEDTSELVLDLEGVEYITSLGLRQLVLADRAMRRRSGRLSLIRVSSAVTESLRICGLSERLNIL